MPAICSSSPSQLGQGGLLTLQSQPGQVVPAGFHCLASLPVQTGDVLPDSIGLLLDAPLGGHHLDHSTLDVLQHLQLFLIGVVQRLPGILGGVEDTVHLRFYNGGHSGKHSHLFTSLLMVVEYDPWRVRAIDQVSGQ